MIRENCIKKTVSFGSVSSDSNGNGHKPILYRPNSFRLNRSRSDGDLSVQRSDLSIPRRAPTIGQPLPSDFLETNNRKVLYIFNSITKCPNCQSKVDIIYSNVNICCGLCFKKFNKQVSNFIIK